ncbi:hypothetical protein V8F20_006266 [Naviculisporaceae sp. PSN 640]
MGSSKVRETPVNVTKTSEVEVTGLDTLPDPFGPSELNEPTKTTKPTQRSQRAESSARSTGPVSPISSDWQKRDTTEVLRPPKVSIPKQTFAQFKKKVEDDWGGQIRESIVGDLLIKIPRTSIEFVPLLNELSITDGQCKDVGIWPSDYEYTILVERTKLKDLLVEKDDEDDVLFHLPQSRYTPAPSFKSPVVRHAFNGVRPKTAGKK